MAPASRAALEMAEVVMAPPRHLALVADVLDPETPCIPWPVPFADGIPQLIALRGQRVAVLASGDPFWFGAGSVLARHLAPGEWQALPGPSAFSLAAARLGWALERTVCLGLHAAPLDRLRPHMANGERAIVLLTGGAAVEALGEWLTNRGFGLTTIHVMEALGGPRERFTTATADTVVGDDLETPLCVALEFRGTGEALTTASGRADDLFDHDGQITKRPVRALTLSALAPTPGAHLWDIGGGSGSVSVEWCLSHPRTRATTVERDSDRAERIRANARSFGVDNRMALVEADALTALHSPEMWEDLPQAVFIGGGLSADVLKILTARLTRGTRIVANAVTLESEMLLTDWHVRLGGDLMRIELAESRPLGTRHGWQAVRPIVQWSAVL